MSGRLFDGRCVGRPRGGLHLGGTLRGGGFLGAFWGSLGPLGASWGLPGPPLGAYWVLGVSWGFLGFLGVSGRVLEEFRGVSCGIPGLFGRCGWRSCPVVVVSGGCLRPVVVRLGGACVQ